MPISGYVAAGASEALEEVLDRRMKEAERQQREKAQADMVAHQNAQLELQREQAAQLQEERESNRKFQQEGRDAAFGATTFANTSVGNITPDQAASIRKNPALASFVAERPIIDAAPIPAVPLPGGTSFELPALKGDESQRFSRLPTDSDKKEALKTVALQRVKERFGSAKTEAERIAAASEAYGSGVQPPPEYMVGATQAELAERAAKVAEAARTARMEDWKTQHDTEVRDRQPRVGPQPPQPTIRMVKPGEKPRLVTGTEAAVLMSQGWDTTAAAGRPVTATQAREISDINQAFRLGKGLYFAPGDTGFFPWAGSKAPDVATSLLGWGVSAKERVGLISIAKQIIAKGMEGGVLRKEDEAKYNAMIPGIGDHERVARTKMNNLMSAMEMGWDTKLDSMEAAGFDVSKYRAQGPDNKFSVTTPDGVTHSFESQEELEEFARLRKGAGG